MCSDCHSGEQMWQEKGNRSVIMTQRGKGKEGAWLRPLASPVADMVLGFTELTLNGCVTAGDASSCLGLLMLGTPGCLCSGPPRGSGPPPHARDWRHRPRARAAPASTSTWSRRSLSRVSCSLACWIMTPSTSSVDPRGDLRRRWSRGGFFEGLL